MSAHFRAVSWNRQKLIYDGVALAGVLLFLLLFAAVSVVRNRTLTAETVLIRGLGLSAFVLLHVILSLGPLARLDPRYLPLLYNRRHLGVLMCVLALGHAVFSLIQFHALGDRSALVSLLTSGGAPRDPANFPFEWMGVLALGVIWLMAVTSHDYWLVTLSPLTWKALHMSVYVAYVLLLGHVVLGVGQDAVHPLFLAAVALGAAVVFGLHIAAGLGVRVGDRPRAADGQGWVDVGPVENLRPGRARTAMVRGERVAVVRHDNGISCVSNVCRHQGGPLGEGRMVDGCLTCPWHGYQYLPESGTSPPPFTEKIATYRVRIVAGRVQVHEAANAPGTRVEPALVPEPLEEFGG
jgi:nitrite reductase/ring-hydroxylating ferredoxin subunit/DMSO/TMAO reductase YedYZ heme-binding membrane subunit